MSESTTPDGQAQATEQKRDEAELIGRIIQSEQKLSEYFTTIITKSVTDQLERRNMVRLRIIGIVGVSLLTVAIPGVMSWVRGTIVEQTETAMTTQFEAATSDLERRFEGFLGQERVYSSFTNYLLYLSDRAAVPKAELTTVRLRLEELGQFSSIVDRNEFPHLLDLVTRLAVRHNDATLLDLLESEFAARLTSARTKPRLARYYGERALGDRFTSKAKREAMARRFQQYVDASEDSADFEMLLPLQLMVDDALKAEDEAETFEGIRLLVKDLTPQDQASFIAETVRYSNPQYFEAATTARTRRIAGVAGNVVLEHRDFYIDLLDNVAVQTALIDISEAEANEGNEAFATALSGFRNAFSGELASTDDAEFRAAVSNIVRNDIATWLDDPVIVDAVNANNRETRDVSRQDIDKLEEQWRSEFNSGAYDLIETVSERPISRFLRRVKRDSVGVYHEIYVMDGVGLIVGASNPNDDYWQGEEDMWLETSKPGGSTMHIGTLAFDESTLAWGIEITLPVIDPANNRRIGAIAFDVDPSMLERSR